MISLWIGVWLGFLTIRSVFLWRKVVFHGTCGCKLLMLFTLWFNTSFRQISTFIMYSQSFINCSFPLINYKTIYSLFHVPFWKGEGNVSTWCAVDLYIYPAVLNEMRKNTSNLFILIVLVWSKSENSSFSITQTSVTSSQSANSSPPFGDPSVCGCLLFLSPPQTSLYARFLLWSLRGASFRGLWRHLC